MEPKITSEDIINHYANVFGTRRVLDEWRESNRKHDLLTDEWIKHTGVFDIVFGKGQTKDMNLVDAWA